MTTLHAPPRPEAARRVAKVARRANVDPFIVMDVFAAANSRAAAADVVRMKVAEPGIGPPEP